MVILVNFLPINIKWINLKFCFWHINWLSSMHQGSTRWLELNTYKDLLKLIESNLINQEWQNIYMIMKFSTKIQASKHIWLKQNENLDFLTVFRFITILHQTCLSSKDPVRKKMAVVKVGWLWVILNFWSSVH